MTFTPPFFLDIQLSKSSLSKNGGAYFSAVCGSNLVPVSATEAHWHRVCDRLLGFFLSRSHVLFLRSLPCSKLFSLPAHSLEIWLERWEILVSTKEWDGCGKPSGPLRPFESFAPAPDIRSCSRSRLTLWCSQVFVIFPTIFPKSGPASWTALSTANFWETKKSERERKNQAAYRRLGANVLL